MYWPTFASENLQNIAKALKKRSKALKHKSWDLKCERVLEQGQNEKQEKLEIEFRCFGQNRDAVVRFFIWDDRWVWVDAREPAKKGWLFEWEYEGRVLGDIGSQLIVAALEDTLNKRNPEDLVQIWEPLLAKGPKGV